MSIMVKRLKVICLLGAFKIHAVAQRNQLENDGEAVCTPFAAQVDIDCRRHAILRRFTR